ncbi:MAG: hypothetical protein CMH49_07260 [Myxococcales bacterium]|nr:hypothetical protein [Myxococcales bacterium]
MSHSPLFKIFLKFGAVGGSGVAVNLLCLALFRMLGFTDSLASALAIEVSIVSNFILNELWTFRDRVSDHRHYLQRALKFQAVSLIGALAQWSVFLTCNVLWVYLGLYAHPGADLWSHYGPLVSQGSWQAIILSPPNVGDWVYLSQFIGILVATTWNFLVNYFWTWKDQ